MLGLDVVVIEHDNSSGNTSTISSTNESSVSSNTSITSDDADAVAAIAAADALAAQAQAAQEAAQAITADYAAQEANNAVFNANVVANVLANDNNGLVNILPDDEDVDLSTPPPIPPMDGVEPNFITQLRMQHFRLTIEEYHQTLHPAIEAVLNDPTGGAGLEDHHMYRISDIGAGLYNFLHNTTDPAIAANIELVRNADPIELAENTAVLRVAEELCDHVVEEMENYNIQHQQGQVDQEAQVNQEGQVDQAGQVGQVGRGRNFLGLTIATGALTLIIILFVLAPEQAIIYSNFV